MGHRAKLSTAAFGAALSLSATAAYAQQLTPRDAFWSASDLVSVSDNTAAAKQTKKTPPHSTTPPVHTTTGKHIDPALVANNGYGAAPHLVRVSTDQMGLRYSLLLQDASGTFVEVAPRQTFHSGERIRLSVMANQAGYLYVIDQGSSGNWSPIYPGPGAAPEVNHVEAGKLYNVPQKTSFRFDPPSGDEKLFIIVSRERLTDLDATIANLKGPAQAAPARPAPTQTLEASNHIPDELVEHLASRDLTLVQEQQVDDTTAATGGEKAVYVVSKGIPPGAKGPEVVAAVTLHHD